MTPKFAQVPIDNVREFWDRRPCNIRHSPKPIGTAEYFNEVEARKYFVEPHIPRFAQFERWAGKKVLEIGCGIGTDTINFARHGAEVTAVDLSRESLELARRRAHVFGLEDRIRFYEGDAEKLSLFVPRQFYDLIYSFGAIHHSPHPEHILAEMRRFMGSTSILKIMVYHRHSWKAFSILLSHGNGRIWKLADLIAKNSEAQTGCPITYTYTRREISALLERQDYRVREIWTDHIFPYRIPDYVQYRYVKEWYFRWMPESVFRSMEQTFGWHLCVTAEIS